MAVKNTEIFQSDRLPEEVLTDVNHIPVAGLREAIRVEIREHSNFVLIGETGSGKTTCLPPLLLELRNELGLKGGIAVTQPRRVATRSVTDRVADMMGCAVGERVGYNIRFENVTQKDTDITFMTDGILLRKIQFDPLLMEYSIVMVDEAHERTLNIDLCLGLLKDVNNRRFEANIDPIRIVVTSATIERNKFAKYIGFDSAKNSLEIPGKMFPVEVFYESEAPWDYDFTQGAAEKVGKIIKNHIDGDILIFMPGKKEITDTIEKIKSQIGENTAEIIPLHAELSPEDQDKIFLPSKKRKIIVSTNVAETSVTIDGIIHVIDSGVIKQTQFNPVTGIEQLVLAEHAISGLEQRKGRAGRTAPGYCYRLFTENSLRCRPLYQTPEIQRANLAQVVLAMKKVGIQNAAEFDFIDRPDIGAIAQAEKTLHLLGALDNEGYITEIGDLMIELALEPRLGRMVIEAMKPNINCVNEICIIAAFLDGKTVFVRPSDINEQRIADHCHEQFKTDKDSDFVVILNVWKAYVNSGYDSEWAKKNYLNEKCLEEAKNVRLDLLDVLEEHGISIDPSTKLKINKDAIGKAVTAGLVGNLMRNSRGFSLKKVDGTKSDIRVHPGSVFSNRSFRDGSLVVSDEIFINPQGKAYACNCLEVKREWLQEVAPEIAKTMSSHSRHRGENRSRHSGRNIYNHRSHNRR
jgi:pre-mRNA-splicing factor ATP-dependent RNA helicase DHX16